MSLALASFRQTKLYDFLAALPLILWFGNAAVQLRPNVVGDAALLVAGRAGLLVTLQFFALLASGAFNLLLIYALAVRDRPVRRASGLLPRFCGFLGTFLGVSILHLPVARLTVGAQAAADILIFVGGALSALVLWQLGRAFSIMPEARILVTDGPYLYARHPLYAVEILTIAGTALQFAQPWAGLLGAAVVALLVARSYFEERVLEEAFSEYAVYRARVKRFGVV